MKLDRSWPLQRKGGAGSESGEHRIPMALRKLVLICVLATSVLSGGFFSNSWKVADQKWFRSHQRDDESLVIGRLVKSRQDGILSAAGLTGFGSPYATAVFWQDKPFEYQYNAYLDGLALGPYTPYKSQIGGQALFFRVLDISIPVPQSIKLQLFYMLTSLLSALTLTMIALWFYLEFDLWVALFVFVSMVLSQWLTVFGRNLFWSIWVFYLPMVIMMYYFRYNRGAPGLMKVGILVFLSVTLKCFINGYEYISTTLIMMMVPFFYYGLMDGSGMRRFLKGAVVAVGFSSLAVFFTITILCFQIASVEGDLLKGVHYIADTLERRSHGDPRDFPRYNVSLESDTTDVIREYLTGEGIRYGVFFDLSKYASASHSVMPRFPLRVRYVDLIGFFFLGSVFILSCKKWYGSEERRRSIALILSTWFSILAPLSWFVIFKAHSYVHTHMNFIVWQMPFTFFGFAVCGMAAKRIGLRVSALRMRPRAGAEE